MLDANLQSQLKTYLERVTRPIQITAHADDGAKSQEMLELLQTLESLSDKISLQVLRDGQGRVPSFDLGTPGQDIHLPSPACRWATSSPRWCWRCCRSAATRPRPPPS
jgi:alkyl hydroperoxide reductase subunit F